MILPKLYNETTEDSGPFQWGICWTLVYRICAKMLSCEFYSMISGDFVPVQIDWQPCYTSARVGTVGWQDCQSICTGTKSPDITE